MTKRMPTLFGEHPVFSQAEMSWVDAGDGVRLRLAKWKGGARGTVHIFNGRTEYIEKYAGIVQKLLDRGFSVSAHDWRGQGKSTRNEKYPDRCHINNFSEFQSDAQAIMKACADMPAPRRLFCHSMGGAIGLRYLSTHHEIDSVVFSAPMWGIYVPIALRPLTSMITRSVRKKHNEWNTVVGTRDEAYETYEPFWRNLLTSNREEYRAMARRLRTFPELATGGPTYYWYFAAIKEIAALHQMALPQVPALVFLGSKEKVVNARMVRALAKKAPSYKVIDLKGAKHESYIETQGVQDELWAHIDEFWSKS